MTEEQYERWHDFAVRMARTCYGGEVRAGWPSGEWVLGEVERFFEGLDPLDIQVIRSWDHSDDYPEGHPHYHAETFEWGTRYAHGPCMGDDMTEQENEGWYEIAADMPAAVWKGRDLAEAEDCGEIEYEIEGLIREEWIGRFYGPVHSCVRAGLDMACEPSAGVVGFTAGDLRRMYAPDPVPDWVTGGPENKWMERTMEHCALGMIHRGSKVNGTFAEMGDGTRVWL